MKPLEQYQAYPIPATTIYYDAAFNCRGEVTLQSVKELADSIAQAGRLICPVAVQPWTGEPGCEYRLIVGHRRFRAVTAFLKWTEIPAYICEGLSDHEARMLNVVENLQRKSLNILEEARAIQNLYPKGAKRAAGGPRIEAADQMGLCPRAVAADAGSGPAEGCRRPAFAGEPGTTRGHGNRPRSRSWPPARSSRRGKAARESSSRPGSRRINARGSGREKRSIAWSNGCWPPALAACRPAWPPGAQVTSLTRNC